jgi:hypothetical protein
MISSIYITLHCSCCLDLERCIVVASSYLSYVEMRSWPNVLRFVVVLFVDFWNVQSAWTTSKPLRNCQVAVIHDHLCGCHASAGIRVHRPSSSHESRRCRPSIRDTAQVSCDVIHALLTGVHRNATVTDDASSSSFQVFACVHILLSRANRPRTVAYPQPDNGRHVT